MINKATHPPVEWIEEKKDTEYAFWTEDGNAYLTFQGSLSLTDWIYNLMINFTFNFHYGMYIKYKVVSKEIEKFILANQDKEIIFTGHSQGAGIALIGFLKMKTKYNLNMKAVLFGCPKTLSLVGLFMYRKYRDSIELYEVCTDPVPRLPPTNFRLGKVVKLGDKKPFWKWSFKDHFPSSYKRYYNGGA